jgi:hypothetical protein
VLEPPCKDHRCLSNQGPSDKGALDDRGELKSQTLCKQEGPVP